MTTPTLTGNLALYRAHLEDPLLFRRRPLRYHLWRSLIRLRRSLSDRLF